MCVRGACEGACVSVWMCVRGACEGGMCEGGMCECVDVCEGCM